VEVVLFKAGPQEADSEDTLHFAEQSGVRLIETYPLEEAAEAYARMLSGKAVPGCDNVKLANNPTEMRAPQIYDSVHRA
jgi:hypothetical protein